MSRPALTEFCPPGTLGRRRLVRWPADLARATKAYRHRDRSCRPVEETQPGYDWTMLPRDSRRTMALRRMDFVLVQCTRIEPLFLQRPKP